METASLVVTDIIVRNRIRSSLSEPAIASLMDSLTKIGLQTPISVIWHDDGPVLVAGRHRLEAAKRLGWPIIKAVEFKDEKQARLWEISENLARSELSDAERRQHIAEWVELTAEKVRHNAAPVAGGTQPVEKGIRKAAKELGITERTVRRAVAAESLPASVKMAADDAGIRTTKRAEIAKLPTVEAQMAAVSDHVAAKEPDMSEAQLFATWLRDKAGPDLPMIISWVENIRAKDILAYLRK